MHMLENELLLSIHKTNENSDLIQRVTAWSNQKKFKPTDFHFIKLLKSIHEKIALSECFVQCYRMKASHSDTLWILEIITELILIHPHNPLYQFVNCKGSSNHQDQTDVSLWKEELKKLRFPQTTQSDNDLKLKLDSLPWPQGSKFKFERRGDRAGIELKLFITNKIDLDKHISALERVKEKI